MNQETLKKRAEILPKRINISTYEFQDWLG
jgi:hypothetical protein